MCIADAAKAAWGRRWSRSVPISLLVVLLSASADVPCALAALSNPIGFASGEKNLDTILADPSSPSEAPVRFAQSSGGPLDGLFSIFKPKKPKTRPPLNVEAPAAQLRKPRIIRSIPQSSTEDSDFDPPKVSVRPSAPKARSYASYRTMCVRLCDGYYWPVNSGTRSSSISRDRNVCEQSCQSEAKLYVQYSLAADAGDMRDLSGKPYRKLKTAFLYRKSYDPECKCKPDPWSKPELSRHEEYRAAERGETLDEASMSANPDQTEVDAAVIRDTLSSETDTPTELDLVTVDGSSVGEEPVVEAPSIADGMKTLLQQTSLKTSIELGAKPADNPKKKKLLPKSVAPVLAPAGAGAQAKAKPAKKRRDINARASR